MPLRGLPFAAILNPMNPTLAWIIPVTPPGQQPPLGIWGPTDPRPTPPIYIPQPPLGMWGPNDPRPTPPIYIPPVGGGTPPGVPIHPIWGPPGFNPPGAGMPPGIGGGPIIPPEQPPVGGPPGQPIFPI